MKKMKKLVCVCVCECLGEAAVKSALLIRSENPTKILLFGLMVSLVSGMFLSSGDTHIYMHKHIHAHTRAHTDGGIWSKWCGGFVEGCSLTFLLLRGQSDLKQPIVREVRGSFR